MVFQIAPLLTVAIRKVVHSSGLKKLVRWILPNQLYALFETKPALCHPVSEQEPLKLILYLIASCVRKFSSFQQPHTRQALVPPCLIPRVPEDPVQQNNKCQSKRKTASASCKKEPRMQIIRTSKHCRQSVNHFWQHELLKCVPYSRCGSMFRPPKRDNNSSSIQWAIVRVTKKRSCLILMLSFSRG